MAQRISTQEALALAKSGNADAQYALSGLLHQRGQFDASLHWLRLAAAQNLVPAQITLATLLMDGRHTHCLLSVRCSIVIPSRLTN